MAVLGKWWLTSGEGESDLLEANAFCPSLRDLQRGPNLLEPRIAEPQIYTSNIQLILMSSYIPSLHPYPIGLKGASTGLRSQFLDTNPLICYLPEVWTSSWRPTRWLSMVPEPEIPRTFERFRSFWDDFMVFDGIFFSWMFILFLVGFGMIPYSFSTSQHV